MEISYSFVMRTYWVYIATNPVNTILYAGVTNNLERRISEHQSKLINGFTARYNIGKLIYAESFQNPQEAIVAEKQIKSWSRVKKFSLIKQRNPQLEDLMSHEEPDPSASG